MLFVYWPRSHGTERALLATADADVHLVIGIIKQSPHVPHCLQRLRLPVVLAVERPAHDLHVAAGRGSDRSAPRHPGVHVHRVTRFPGVYEHSVKCFQGANASGCLRSVAAALRLCQWRWHFDEVRWGRVQGGERPCLAAVGGHLSRSK
jgi:hypothetical protein